MEVLVFGAGAVGCYLGGRLALAGHHVTLVSRPETADAVNRDGLIIRQSDGSYTLYPRAVSALSEAFLERTDYNLVIMTMKSYDLEVALDQLREALPRPRRILGTQNGIGVEEMIAARFAPETILAGAVTAPISRVDANHVAVERPGRGLAISPMRAGDDVTTWQTLFVDAGIRTVTIPDYRAMKWSKAFLNIVGNAAAAILNRPPGELYRQQSVFDLETRMLNETLAVMTALRIPVVNLPGAAARPLALSLRWSPRSLRQPILSRIVARGRGDKMPSFYMDVCAGKGRSEVVYHNGAIAAAGEANRVAVPVNRALNDILVKLARGELDRAYFDGRPDRLVAAVSRYEKEPARVI